MRWKNSNSLKVGTKRVVRKFLLIPRSFGEGQTRWFEFADVAEEVVRRYSEFGIDSKIWVETGFVD